MNPDPSRQSSYPPTAGIVLWWLPVGAGAPTRFSQVTSQWWERLDARFEHRTPQRLVHAALEVHTNDQQLFIEMAPEWSASQDPLREVVKRGPVGLEVLGRSKLFRYEVRCWSNGDLTDRQYAIGGPVTVTEDESIARALLENIANVPALTWGRSVHAPGDMWNSNSLVSWLLTMAGIDVTSLVPPDEARAPGWATGIVVAQRRLTSP